MSLILLFSMSVGILFFLVLFVVIKHYVVPKSTYQKRISSIHQLNTVDASRAMNSLATARGTAQNMDDQSFHNRVIKPLIEYLERHFLELTPAALAETIQHKIIVAGLKNKLSVGGFSMIMTIFIGFMTYFAHRYTATHTLAPVQVAMCLLLGAILGGAMPMVMLNSAISRRKERMLRQLPELLDLMCVSVQAGLTFEAAIRKIIQRTTGDLIDEFSVAMDDMKMGMPRRQALRSMANRCDLQELSLFVTSLIQSERLGTSIGGTLTIQANNMRERRRQAVKAEALKAPIKILFPLVLFIFPALFVVILMPVVLALIKHF
ncbi:type II secretion system F family protein [uncultured Anaerovibrio sp.]|uniref:type II secretion system F family protein n=1 Tax=uncultured Anaerovibrio sp. TaxID=361586 RepID=UPI002626C5DD|nr:type II secretion system F family protein [uncultured Anaerovibrio sp.]